MHKRLRDAVRIKEIVGQHMDEPGSVTVKALRKERLGRKLNTIYGIRSNLRCKRQQRKGKAKVAETSAMSFEQMINRLEVKRDGITGCINTLMPALGLFRRLLEEEMK